MLSQPKSTEAKDNEVNVSLVVMAKGIYHVIQLSGDRRGLG